jgi:hypothetical protein
MANDNTAIKTANTNALESVDLKIIIQIFTCADIKS